MSRVSLSDGRVVTVEPGTRVRDLPAGTIPNDVIACRVNGELSDLDRRIRGDAEVAFVTKGSEDALAVLRHSTSHVLATAVKRLFPEARLAIGPPIKDGFYYDFGVDRPFLPEDLERIEAEMKKVIAERQAFTRSERPRAEAIDAVRAKGEPFKEEIIRDLPDEETLSFYRNGEFEDLCRGPHLSTTAEIPPDGIKLTSVAGAYWRGSETNPMLQRIYGTAFRTSKELRIHLERIEEAKRRDHRRLGKDLDLFSFQDEGPGFPFWHPKGTFLYNAIVDFHRALQRKAGYEEIRTPSILHEALWHRSGHWDHYKNNMYFTEIEDRTYAVKPMNCPGGILVYKSRAHSYRELPLRLGEYGQVHRFEKSGVLHGLFRVRAFTQDDAHIFCTPEQLLQEIKGVISLLREVYRTFGFDKIQVELSTRPAKSIGSDEIWEKATGALENALKESDVRYKVNPGDGAFYGPKIDFHIEDSLGRTWQCGTIQVDFAMPERFELEYQGPDGQMHRPVMVHRAILGSLERFIGIFVEHTGGAFPVWLAPVQARVIPVSEKSLGYAEGVAASLREAGFRIEVDASSEKVGYKVRAGAVEKIPYLLVVGEKESETGNVAVRARGGSEARTLRLDEFRETLVRDVEGKGF